MKIEHYSIDNQLFKTALNLQGTSQVQMRPRQGRTSNRYAFLETCDPVGVAII